MVSPQRSALHLPTRDHPLLEDPASCRNLSLGLPLSSMLVNIGARFTRTLDAVDVDTLTDVARLRRHLGHSLLRLIAVGGDFLEGRTSYENHLITVTSSNNNYNKACYLSKII